MKGTVTVFFFLLLLLKQWCCANMLGLLCVLKLRIIFFMN